MTKQLFWDQSNYKRSRKFNSLSNLFVAEAENKSCQVIPKSFLWNSMLKVKTIFLKGPIKFARNLPEDLWSSAEQSLAEQEDLGSNSSSFLK